MAVTIEDIQRSLLFAVWIWVYAVSAVSRRLVSDYASRASVPLTRKQFVGYILLRAIYNISPLHPLYKYPGPLLWRASRLPASYHQARGDLYARIADIHTHYGPTIRLSPDELSFTAPEAWLDIYNSRPQLQKSDYHFPPPVKEKLPASMITASDAEHTRLRRLANPAFLNAGIAEVEPILQHFVDLLCTQLIDASKEGSQNICEWLLWALNDVISKLALDRDFQCLEKRRMHPWPALLLDSLKQAALVNQLRWFGVSLRLLQPLMTEQQLKAQEYFYNTAQTAIKERLAREKSESTATTNGEKKRPDIVGLMLREMKDGNRLTEQEITANSILIVVGGAETTSTLLSAAFYHLCKTPRVMQKLKAEIRRKFASPDEITIKSTADVPYLKATLDETLRIFPVASYITPRVIPKGGHLVNGELVPEGVSGVVLFIFLFLFLFFCI